MRYLDIQQNEPMVQLDLLGQQLRSLRAEPGTPENSALVADIEGHLSSPSPYKPTEYLINLFKRIEKEGEAQVSLSRPEDHREDPMIDAMVDLFMAQNFGSQDQKATADAKFTILMSLANGSHPAAIEFFRSLIRQNDDETILSGAMLYFARNGHADLVEELLAKAIFRSSSLKGKKELLEAALTYDVMEHMPFELRHTLYWRQRELGINNRLWLKKGEKEKIRPRDYRSNPKLSIALAASHDDEVVNWAIEQLDNNRSAEDDALPITILINSGTDIAEEKVQNLFCEGGSRRRAIIKGFAEVTHDNSIDWMLRLALFDGLSDSERILYIKTLSIRSHEASRRGKSWEGDEDEEILLGFLTNDPKIIDIIRQEATPLECH
jgi:hypothetical protein